MQTDSNIIRSSQSPTNRSSYAGTASFEERMQLLEDLNGRAGYRAPDTIVPPGTALIPMGEEKKRALDREVNALPLAEAAIPAYLERRALLQAKDVADSLTNLRMRSEDGKLFRVLSGGQAGPAIGYNHTGLGQLVSFYSEALGLPRGFTGALEFLSPRARAEAFNDIAVRADGKVEPDEVRVYRTLLHPVTGERFLRAVTSQKHVLDKGDGPAVATALRAMLPAGTRVRITESWDRTTFECFWPMMAREVRVGDVVLARASVTISETKDMSARVLDGLLRVLCLNFTTAWYGAEARFTSKHMGADFTKRLGRAFAGSVERVRPFVEAFGDAYSKPLPAFAPTRAEVLDRVESRFQSPAETATHAAALWDADGVKGAGDTLAGLANAMTRASQELGMEDAEIVEEAAGRLVAEGWAALA